MVLFPTIRSLMFAILIGSPAGCTSHPFHNTSRGNTSPPEIISNHMIKSESKNDDNVGYVVNLIDGTVVAISKNEMNTIEDLVSENSMQNITISIVSILNASPLSTAVLCAVISEAYRRHSPSDLAVITKSIAAAVAMSNRTDKRESLELHMYTPGVNPADLVQGAQWIDLALAEDLSEFARTNRPGQPLPFFRSQENRLSVLSRPGEIQFAALRFHNRVQPVRFGLSSIGLLRIPVRYLTDTGAGPSPERHIITRFLRCTGVM